VVGRGGDPVLQGGGGFAIHHDDGEPLGKGVDQRLECAGLAAAGRAADQGVMAEVVDLDCYREEGIDVADCPAVPSVGDTGLRAHTCKPARSAAFFRREGKLALWRPPEEPRVLDAKIEIEKCGHEGQRHDEFPDVVLVLHESGPFSVFLYGLGAS
jgi:hypothetical protein